MRPLLALLLCATGCAYRPRVLTYSWGSIVAVDSNTLARKCSASKAKWDDGRTKGKWAPVGGCYFAETKEIWIDEDAPWCVLAHELAHKDGLTDPDRVGMGCKR
jgi:hypothetical protein